MPIARWIAQLQRRRAEDKPPEPRARPMVSPIQVIVGRLGDYNPQVQGREWYSVVDKMRNNSRILALEYILTLPIIATHWEVYPARRAGSAGREAAELLHADLTEHSITTLTDVLRLGILARFYGLRCLEPVWTIDSDRVRIADMTDIHPQTIFRVEVNDAGKPVALIQRVGASEEIRLPWQEIVSFVWRSEGGDPMGYPDLRSLYADWYRLEYLYSILSVAAERAGIGAWSATLPRNLYDNEQLRREMVSILKSIRSYEGGALILPEGVTVQVLRAVEQQGVDALLKMAEHYEMCLATGIIANILQLGMRNIGTQALATVLFDLYLLQLNYTARWLADTINTQIVRQWVRYNYPGMPPEEQPNLRYTDMRLLLQRSAIVESVVRTIQSGIIPAGTDIEDYMRDLLSLPPAQRTQRQLQRTDRQDVIQLQRDITTDTSPRPPSEEDFDRAMRRYLDAVSAEISDRLSPILDGVTRADERSKSDAIRRIAAIEIPEPYKRDYQQLVIDYLTRFATEARAALRTELGVNLSDSLPPLLVSYIAVKAETIARDHIERLRAELVYSALSQVLREVDVVDARTLARSVASRRLSTDSQRWREEAEQILSRINEELNE